MRGFATHGRVGAIIPVGHGAAAVVVRDGAILAPPIDYEQQIPPEDLSDYDSDRDPFSQTGSPCLPDGLNLGTQLHYLERSCPTCWMKPRRSCLGRNTGPGACVALPPAK